MRRVMRLRLGLGLEPCVRGADHRAGRAGELAAGQRQHHHELGRRRRPGHWMTRSVSSSAVAAEVGNLGRYTR